MNKKTKMNMKRTIGIIVVAIVAILFYASVWTSEDNSLSDCFALSGIILSFQAAATILVVENTRNK
jgi:protein-S-isoprenylcysteine O-methyltransferase Ste14